MEVSLEVNAVRKFYRNDASQEFGPIFDLPLQVRNTDILELKFFLNFPNSILSARRQILRHLIMREHIPATQEKI